MEKQILFDINFDEDIEFIKRNDGYKLLVRMADEKIRQYVHLINSDTRVVFVCSLDRYKNNLSINIDFEESEDVYYNSGKVLLAEINSIIEKTVKKHESIPRLKDNQPDPTRIKEIYFGIEPLNILSKKYNNINDNAAELNGLVSIHRLPNTDQAIDDARTEIMYSMGYCLGVADVEMILKSL